MPIIESIIWRRIYNSHVNFTNEYVVNLDNGLFGVGASSQGETISIYEDKDFLDDPNKILQAMRKDGILKRPIEQDEFDHYLQKNISSIGRNNAYALSLALYNSETTTSSIDDALSQSRNDVFVPFLCLNILNGGKHAYTNPVLSDFPEYLFVAKDNNIHEVIADHHLVQKAVREKLINFPKTVVSGHPVYTFATTDNRECIEFLLNIRDYLGFSEKYELMIDASGGDLWYDGKYWMKVTDESSMSQEEYLNYWTDIIEQYEVRYLEDPFHEEDIENWQQLTEAQQKCYIIGDNFYSTDSDRIKEGAEKNYTHGVVIKPNQAGTITAVKRAIEVARSHDQIAITSHRSISTESTLLSRLTCLSGVKYMKIGPLLTDYSAVMRLNEIIRLTQNKICN